MKRNEIYISTLFQLQNDVVLEDFNNSIIIFGGYFGYFVNLNSLCFIDMRYKSSQCTVILPGISSIAVYNQEESILISLSGNGVIGLLKCIDNKVEYLHDLFDIASICSIDSDTQYQHKSIFFDIIKRLLLIRWNINICLYSIPYQDSGDLVVDFVISLQKDFTYYEIWSDNENSCLLVLTDTTNIISSLALFCDENLKWSVVYDNMENGGIMIEETKTKHTSWITALSRNTNLDRNLPYNTNITAVGDSLGMISFWVCNFNEMSNTTNVKKKSNLKYLMRNKTISNKNGISDILLDLNCDIWWIGDNSGAITGAQLTIVNKEIHPYRRIMLFGTIGGPTQIQWIHNISDTKQNSKTGVLRAFSSNCGMLVECKMNNSIESIFRVWPGSVDVPAPIPLNSNHGSRAITSDSVHTFSHAVVDVCVVLHHWNIIATIGSSSRYLNFTDIDSGVLQYSILLEESFCKSIAVYEIPFELHAYIALGFANGKFIVIKLNRLCEFVPIISDDQSQIENVIEINKRNSLKSETIINFDILGAVTTNVDGQNTSFDIEDPKSNKSYAEMDDDNLSETSEQSQILHNVPNHRELSVWTEDAEETSNLSGDSISNSFIFPTKKKNNNELYSHDIDFSSQFSPLPISDIIFSMRGEFIAICYMKKVIIVFNNCLEIRKISLKIKFEEMFYDIQSIQSNPMEPSLSSTGVSMIDDKMINEQDTLKLLLQSSTTIKILDAIKGILLNEIELFPTFINEPIMRGCAWSILLNDNNKQSEDNQLTNQHEGIIGIFVGNDMKIFFFNEDENKAYQFELNSHKNNTNNSATKTLDNKLDSLMKGISIHDLKLFSPLACIWTFRTLLLLRIQCNLEKRMEILRYEEFFLTSCNERIIYSSALKIKSNVRKHRAILVLSSGHVLIIHI